MISNFQKTKAYFETLFKDNWTSTPVHYAGQEFSADTLDRWVNVIYKPLGGENTAYTGASMLINGTLTVICWAENDVEAMKLGDEVVAFVSAQKEFTMRMFEVNDHGWNESGSVYLYLTFDIKSHDMSC